jgi:hypothetical protein
LKKLGAQVKKFNNSNLNLIIISHRISRVFLTAVAKKSSPIKKPQVLQLVNGRRPDAAFGNSSGDQQMLGYTKGGTGPRLTMLVTHEYSARLTNTTMKIILSHFD